ncbi:SPOR domain-containing protein [Polynucleobacter sp.]|uniref:SPOR domain-containing protein n=1 Tax=Polynucleobacter sp. TaxID=2029855 RepID=UPI00333E8A31
MKKPNQQNGFSKRVSSNTQFGGTILGFILGLGVGLGIAFVIAFYLSKNTPQERPGMRAPNLPLNIIKPAPPPAEGETTIPTEPIDLNKPLQGKSSTNSGPDTISDLLNSKKSAETSSAPAGKSDAQYYLQIGAFVKRADADAQKATLAMQGIQVLLSEVTSEGNTLWRVRIGPYGSSEETNSMRDKLNGMGIKPTLIKSSKP